MSETLERLKFLQTACADILIDAGNILLNLLENPLDIQFKGRYNIVTQADLASERFILDKLAQLTPGITIVAEESDSNSTGNPLNPHEPVWFVDPLDGTTNYAHGFPHFCISLALCKDQESLLGLIYDPCKKELFSAVRGNGATLNGTVLRVSDSDDLEHSLIATGFPYKIRELEKNNLIEFCAFRYRTQGVRRFGAAALDLAYVAAGRLDGFWERWLKPWDTAAGILMVEEAGGKVSLFNGSRYSVWEPEILASNGPIHSEMIRILTDNWPALPEELKR